MVVLGIAVLLLLLGWPKVKRLLLQANVRSSRGAVIGFYQQGRLRAVQSGRATSIWFSGNRMWVTAKPRRTIGGSGTYDTLGYVYDFNQRYGVTISPTPDTLINFNARGLGITPSDVTVALSRSGVRDSIVINQIGRVSR